jgi:hypothetical protein
VKLETTLEELVDVAELPIADRVRAVCMEEALWRLDLPSPFIAEHETWTIAI